MERNQIKIIKITKPLLYILLAVLSLMCERTPVSPPQKALKSERSMAKTSPEVYTYKIINVYPHDANAFTQGLIYHNGYLYESTGLYGKSSLRKTDLETGEILQYKAMDPALFAEGLTCYQQVLYQLTWLGQKGFVYQLDTFDQIDEFAYPRQGWGLTNDSEKLIMSDGTCRLYFIDPSTFCTLDSIEVNHQDGAVTHLNELEYINGHIYANLWQTDLIARIHPASGMIISWIDCQGLLPAEDCTANTGVLNGIAYDKVQNRLFLTGKNWPKLFEIKPVTSVTYTFSHPGWYLISLPLEPQSSSIDQLFPDLTNGIAYFWDTENSSYLTAQNLEAGKGYWLEIHSACSVTIEGVPKESCALTLKKGWNLVGLPLHPIQQYSARPPNAVLQPFLFYDPQDKQYHFTDRLNPALGYWLFANENCILYHTIYDQRHIEKKGQKQYPPPPPKSNV